MEALTLPEVITGVVAMQNGAADAIEQADEEVAKASETNNIVRRRGSTLRRTLFLGKKVIGFVSVTVIVHKMQAVFLSSI